MTADRAAPQLAQKPCSGANRGAAHVEQKPNDVDTRISLSDEPSVLRLTTRTLQAVSNRDKSSGVVE